MPHLVAALVRQDDRAATAATTGNLAKAVAEERRLLFARRAESETNGMFLLAIDLAGVALILILATVLTVSTRRSRRELQDSLSATQATNEALEGRTPPGGARRRVPPTAPQGGGKR